MLNSGKENAELLNAVALLVLDVQECFLETLSDKRRFLNRCVFAIDAARALGLKTIFTEQVPSKLGPTYAKLLQRARQPMIFPKTAFSALSAPGLQNYLRDQEVYHLLVCGLETPICVYQTGLQSVDEDIDLTILTDAVGCRRAEDEPFVIDALRELGCQLLPSETVFYSLIRDVSHPQFRAFNQLVKTFSEKNFDLDAYLESPPRIESSAGSPGKSKSGKRSRGRRSRNRNPEPSNQESPAKKKATRSPSKEPASTASLSKNSKTKKGSIPPKPKKASSASGPKRPTGKTSPRKNAKTD